MKHLSPAQIETIYAKLQLSLQEMTALLDSLTDSAKPVNLEEPIGRISRMDAMLEQNMAKANKEQVNLKIKQIKASLEDYKKDSLGICRLCKGGISFKRLEAKPEAPFCLDCQKKIEAKKNV